MANGCVQNFAYILASLGLVFLITTTCVNEWKIHSHTDQGILKAVQISEGLWMTCKFLSTGNWECTEFDSILHTPKFIQITRALMILSIGMSLLGLAVSMLGLKCTLCLEASEVTKNKVAFTGAIFIVLAGLTALGTVSWYAHEVIVSFYDPSQREKYSLGTCLFLGWAAAILSMVGGCLLASCSLPLSSPARSYSSKGQSLTMTQVSAGKEYV